MVGLINLTVLKVNTLFQKKRRRWCTVGDLSKSPTVDKAEEEGLGLFIGLLVRVCVCAWIYHAPPHLKPLDFNLRATVAPFHDQIQAVWYQSDGPLGPARPLFILSPIMLLFYYAPPYFLLAPPVFYFFIFFMPF